MSAASGNAKESDSTAGASRRRFNSRGLLHQKSQEQRVAVICL